jgi:ferritin-like metal-binding protein YciE
MGKTKLETFRDLFIHELQDLYSAESQLIEALPKMQKAATTDKLVNAFGHHLEETKQQKQRLEEIGEILGVDLSGMKCEAMKGLIEEGEEIVNAKADANIKDAALIAAAQRVEHYEMAGYGVAVHYADLLNETQVSELLSDTLEEEKSADSKLNRIAKTSVNIKAKAVH